MTGGLDASSAILKYDANGNELWAVFQTNLSYAVMTMDMAGDLVVAATKVDAGSEALAFVTLKYAPNGEKLWDQQYDRVVPFYSFRDDGLWDGPRAIATDDTGAVYVAGGSLYDYATIKYHAGGDFQRVARYDGPEGGLDSAAAIAVDAEGNAYVTGTTEAGASTSQTTIKYDYSGRQLWVVHYDAAEYWRDGGVDIAIDSAGHVYVAGTSSSGRPNGSDYSIVKYDSSGNLLWSTRYDGGGGNDYATALIVDGVGNIYVTGVGFTVKYDTKGNQLWDRAFPGGYGSALAVDRLGNVYVAGGAAIIKYDSSGNELWGKSFPYAHDIAVDSADNVYVTGGIGSYITRKYDPSGNELWAQSSQLEGSANALAVDSSGGVVVTGSWTEDGKTSLTGTIKYDSQGNVLWLAEDICCGTDIAIDAADNVYVAAGRLLKYDHFGKQLWIGSGSPGAAIALSGGNVYATGTASSAAGGVSTFWTAMYVQPRLLMVSRAVGMAALTISWDAPATDFVLERSDSLRGSDKAWTQIPFPYQTNAGRIFIEEPLPVGNRFYRLRKP